MTRELVHRASPPGQPSVVHKRGRVIGSTLAKGVTRHTWRRDSMIAHPSILTGSGAFAIRVRYDAGAWVLVFEGIE